MRNSPRLQALAAAILFSTGGAGIKVAAFTGAQVTCLRSGIAAVALLVWLGPRVQITPAVLGLGTVYACMITIFVHSTKLTTAANAIFLQSTAPLYLLCLAPVLLGERFRPRDLLYMAALGAGLVLCLVGQPTPTATAPDPVTGNLLGAAGGFVWALTLLSLRAAGREGSSRDLGIRVVLAGNLLACAASLPLAWPLPDRAPAAEWATIVYLGIVQIGLAYVCLTRAMRTLPALDASLLLLLEPVLNPIWAWAIHREQPGRWVLIGGAVILAATGAKALHDRRN